LKVKISRVFTLDLSNVEHPSRKIYNIDTIPANARQWLHARD